MAVLAPNSLMLLAGALWGCAGEGGAGDVNTRLAPAEIGYILGHSGAKVLLVDGELWRRSSSGGGVNGAVARPR